MTRRDLRAPALAAASLAAVIAAVPGGALAGGHVPAAAAVTARAAGGTAPGPGGAVLASSVIHGRVSGRGSRWLFAGGLPDPWRGPPPASRLTGRPEHVVTVTGASLAGRPDTGDQVLMANVANANLSGTTSFHVFEHGTATFRVPSGIYWAVAVFTQRSGRGRITSMRMDVLPQFTVTRNTTVHARALAATSKVTMSTPRPAIMRSSTLTVVRAAPHAPPNLLSPKVNGLEQALSGAPLWINPVRRAPSYGTLRVFTSAQLTSPGRVARYIYTLDFANPPGTIAPQHFTARPAGLATVSERYVQDVRSVSAWQTMGGTLYQIRTSFIGGPTLALWLPSRLVEYISASPPMLWQTSYSEYRTIRRGQTPGGQASAVRLLHGGEHLTQDWNAYPLHPGTNASFPGTGFFPVEPSAVRSGNTLRLGVTPFSDNQPGHLGAGLVVPFPGKANQVRGRYALYQSGVQIAGGNAVSATAGNGDLQVSAHLAAKPALVKFVLLASRASAQYPLSPTSRDVWTWPTRPAPAATIPAPWVCDLAAGRPDRHCAAQPMITLDYHVAGLSLAGTTGPGRQAVTISAGHIQPAARLPVTRARTWVSFDSGKTWQRARVRPLGAGRFRATFTVPPSASVTLRVTASDAAGSTLTETIPGAYRATA